MTRWPRVENGGGGEACFLPLPKGPCPCVPKQKVGPRVGVGPRGPNLSKLARGKAKAGSKCRGKGERKERVMVQK